MRNCDPISLLWFLQSRKHYFMSFSSSPTRLSDTENSKVLAEKSWTKHQWNALPPQSNQIEAKQATVSTVLPISPKFLLMWGCCCDFPQLTWSSLIAFSFHLDIFPSCAVCFCCSDILECCFVSRGPLRCFFFLFPKPSNSIIYFSFELFICKSFFVTIYIFDVESKQKSGTFSNDLALQFLKLCSISPDYPCFVSAAFAI